MPICIGGKTNDEIDVLVNFLELLDDVDVFQEGTAIHTWSGHPERILYIMVDWCSRHDDDAKSVSPIAVLDVPSDLCAGYIDLSQALRTLSMP